MKTTYGEFCWLELGTNDQEKAKEFYQKLHNWTFQDSPMPDGCIYTVAMQEQQAVAGIYSLTKDMLEKQIPPHWLLYIAVENVEDKAEIVKKAGGLILHGPVPIPDMGKMLIIQDPTGAVIAFWENDKMSEGMAQGKLGTFNWGELMTKDVEKVTTFYSEVLGWKTKKVDDNYFVFSVNEHEIAGMMEITEKMGPIPSYWSAYIEVENCENSVKTAVDSGASILLNTTLIPEVGSFAVLKDPQGATFNIIEMLKK